MDLLQSWNRCLTCLRDDFDDVRIIAFGDLEIRTPGKWQVSLSHNNGCFGANVVSPAVLDICRKRPADYHNSQLLCQRLHPSEIGR